MRAAFLTGTEHRDVALTSPRLRFPVLALRVERMLTMQRKCARCPRNYRSRPTGHRWEFLKLCDRCCEREGR